MPPSSKRKLPMEDDKPGSGPLEKTDAGEKNPAEVPAPSEQQMPDLLTWVPTLQDMDSSFGRAALILLLRRYKEIITMVVDAKIAEFDEEKNKSAVPERTDNTNVVEDAGGGEAGSSSTEAPRTPAKPAEARPDPPSTGNHRESAHNLVDGEEGRLWEMTRRNDPALREQARLRLIHTAIGNEAPFHSGICYDLGEL